MSNYASIAFTGIVKRLQESAGSREGYAAAEDNPPPVLGDDHRSFIAARDSFYMASVGETGWPYVQHRGGPTGFVKVLDATHLGFADYAGNRQYISTGNALHDDRVSLFFMDYPNRRRLKIFAHAKIVAPGDHPELTERIVDPAYRARVERLFLFEIAGLSWNCSAHITKRFTEAEIERAVDPLIQRIKELEARLAVTAEH